MQKILQGLLVLLAISMARCAGGSTYYVATTGSDAPSASGTSWDTAFLTISNALAHPSPTVVYVRNGTYYLTNQINMASGCQLLGGYGGTTPEPGARGDDPASSCIVDGSAFCRVFNVSNCVAGTLIDGFTIRNGKSSGNGGGLYVHGSTSTISHNKIIVNKSAASANGGGLFETNSAVVISNNVIAGNMGGGVGGVGGYGGGIFSSSGIILVNNTIFANSNSLAAVSNAGGIYLAGGTNAIRNNIIAANDRYGVLVKTGVPVTVTFSHNDFWGNIVSNYVNCSPGGTDISRNPILVGGGDYHEQSRAGSWHNGDWMVDANHSPCIDAGDPVGDFPLEPADNGGLINMGAYGNTPTASKSIGYIPDPAPRYVRPAAEATPAWPYTNWVTAAGDLQTALNPADGQPVYVKCGTYIITNGALVTGTAQLLGGYMGAGSPGDRTNSPADYCILDAKTSNGVFSCVGYYDIGTVIDGFTIQKGSVAVVGGGGFYIYGTGPLVISHNKILSNSSGKYINGGGLAILNSTVVVTNNVIAGNTGGAASGGQGGGGGVYMGSGSLTLVNNTIYGNTASLGQTTGYGGGLCLAGGNSIIQNNIIALNEPHGVKVVGGTVSFSYNDVWANSVTNYCNCSPGTGDISRNPLLVNAGGGDYHEQSRAGSWHNGAWMVDPNHSPCIDAGEPTDDASLEPGPNGGLINMGAYGNTPAASKSIGYIPDPAPRYVRPAAEATPAWPYTNWTTAAGDLQTALNPADGRPVYVKIGTYFITNGALTLYSAQLLGGYLGTGNPGDRTNNPADACILDAKNTTQQRVISCWASSPGTVIDGFTIRGGSANVWGGVGLYAYRSALTISHNMIVANAGNDSSGVIGGSLGIQNSGAAGISVVISNNVIARNTCQGVCSGIRADTGIILVNNTIYSNSAAYNPTYGSASVYLGGGTNNIVKNNIIATNNSGIQVIAGVTAVFSYNDVWGSSISNYYKCSAGPNDISVNPLLVNPGGGDYHEQSKGGSWHNGAWTADPGNSPCIDAGDPTSDYSLEPQPNGKRINMGAYGGTAQASRSRLLSGSMMIMK